MGLVRERVFMQRCGLPVLSHAGLAIALTILFKGLRPPAADPQQNEGMMLRGYENHEAIALVTCAS